MLKNFFSILFLLGFAITNAQVSADCTNAVPICGNTPQIGRVAGAGANDFQEPGQSGCITIGETNSAWYRFKTGASGLLGFNIGFDSAEDWDFALYRTDDCSTLGAPVRCNFYDNNDNDGITGNEYFFTGVGVDPMGYTENFQYEDWIQVEPGEEYYLWINNFDNTNSGFSVQFTGPIFESHPATALDCSIISNLLGPPRLACEGEAQALDASTPEAVAYEWYRDTGSGFELLADETTSLVTVQESGMYRVVVAMPDEVNVYSDVMVGYSPVPVAHPLTMESWCTEDVGFDLGIKDGEVVGDQNPNALVVSYHRSSYDANLGANPLPRFYESTIQGTETIYVRVSALHNPKCYDATQAFELIRLKTPPLDFDNQVYICEGGYATIGDKDNPYYTYRWSTGETTANITVSQIGEYTVTATFEEGSHTCSNTKTVTVTKSVLPVISDIEIKGLNDENSITVQVEDQGLFEYQLDDDTPQTDNVFNDVMPGAHTVTVHDLNGCGIVSEEVAVAGFLKFFTPNGDGRNDVWQIEGLQSLINPVVYIYDRYGRLVAQLSNTINVWDGTFEGRPLPTSDYWFKLTYEDANGDRVVAKHVENHFTLKR
ncbi:MAG: T9SS type B sorting domain-containing protein [Flavobacteriaceae bacterium]